MSLAAGSFLTTPIPHDEAIYSSSAAFNGFGEIGCGISAKVVVTQNVSGTIGETSHLTKTSVSQAVKGQMGTSDVEGTKLTHQTVKGEIGAKEIGIANTGTHAVVTGSGHVALSARVIVNDKVKGAIGDSLVGQSIISSAVSGRISDTLTQTDVVSQTAEGEIGVEETAVVTLGHISPTETKVDVKVFNTTLRVKLRTTHE